MKIKIEEVRPGELFWVSPVYHAQSHVSDAVIMTVADCEKPSYVQRGFIVEKRNLPDEVWVNRKEPETEDTQMLVLRCDKAPDDTLEFYPELEGESLVVKVRSFSESLSMIVNAMVVLSAEDEVKVVDYLLKRAAKGVIESIAGPDRQGSNIIDGNKNKGDDFSRIVDTGPRLELQGVRVLGWGDTWNMCVMEREGKYRPGLVFNIQGWEFMPIEAEEVELLSLLLRRRGCVAITLEEMEEYSKMKERSNTTRVYLQAEMERTATELARSMNCTLSEVYTMAAEMYKPKDAAQVPAETEQDKYWRMFKNVLNLLTVPGVSAPTRARIRDTVRGFWELNPLLGGPKGELAQMVELEPYWNNFESQVRKSRGEVSPLI